MSIHTSVVVKWQDVLAVLGLLCEKKVNKAALESKGRGLKIATRCGGSRIHEKKLRLDLFCHCMQPTMLQLPKQLVDLGATATAIPIDAGCQTSYSSLDVSVQQKETQTSSAASDTKSPG